MQTHNNRREFDLRNRPAIRTWGSGVFHSGVRS
jgi:hypothetical protein